MNSFIYLLTFFSVIYNINGRIISFNNKTINQNNSSNSILSKKPLILFSIENSIRNELKLGQVSGLASSISNPNHLIIFHRGSRKWNQQSFPDVYNFNRKKFGAIRENTILTVNSQTGEIINQWGNNTFYMPHGLTTDNQGNVWLTDVAMHQVFKYSGNKLLLTLGELFVPGDDTKHFCKPTDVVVSKDGSNIYVSDGYCNSRIVKFDSNGKLIKQYQMPLGKMPLIVPHSLILIESLNLICVADRENQRIVCFNTKNDEGNVKYIIENTLLNTVYAITYDSTRNYIYAISGKTRFSPAIGYTFSANPKSFGNLISTWKLLDKYGEPHDLTMSLDGRSLFVGEIRPNRIISFDILN
ncbi:unnamed protein product [Adineta steineri]|uniref:peptidylamidoglycolate lyase n=1 Tax=Adineta steineri TaxID=433720 RepID=A0A814D3N7_9BILA|nr:unnamed protein product [Adineta steineri]CAF1441463.1 unnamed protein product [Adineta steineri]CAF1442541.1 unnamed protein product [Adineta steineri]